MIMSFKVARSADHRCLLFSPQDKEQLPLFMHCAGGSIAITEDAFFDEYLSVFQAHGIQVMLPANYEAKA